MRVRLGTRGSALAMAQARMSAARLAGAGFEPELVLIKTQGDRVQDRAFADVGEAGVFVRELESALLDERIDVAVHSYKDLPSKSLDGLVVAAMPERRDPADVLVVPGGRGITSFEHLAEGAVVGTASARREALLKDARPDLGVRLLRGNVPTRLNALRSGSYDAIVLAAAGLERLLKRPDAQAGDQESLGDFLEGLDIVRLDPSWFVPAPTQGALAWQTREDAWRERLSPFDDPAYSRAVAAERALLADVQGSCDLPFGAWAWTPRGLPDEELTLEAFLAVDGDVQRARVRGSSALGVATQAMAQLRPSESGS